MTAQTEQERTRHSEVLATVERTIIEVVGDDFYEVYEVGLDSTSPTLSSWRASRSRRSPKS